MSPAEVVGWDRLRHGGLLLDAPRLREVARRHQPEPLSSFDERELRRLATAVLDGSGEVPAFVSFVLRKVCGFSESAGTWQRGTTVPAEWGRVAITGETIKPRQLWRGHAGGLLPVFLDDEKRIGVGRGRRATSQVLQWLRAGGERLALLTNGREWRLVFAGLDFDAWCEWDLDLWFEEGGLSPQVAALRTLLAPSLWTPPEKDTPSPLLRAILDSRKGQADLSAVLGERVREAVELLVQAHGEILKERCAGVDPADIYRAAVRMVMRMVVVLFAESRELLPRDNALYHGAYGLTGLLEELEKVAARGGNRLARSWSAWPRVLALSRLVHQGSHHPALPVPAYGGELFAPGDPADDDGLARALALFETAAFDRELLPDRDVHRILERITRTRVKLRQGRSSTWVPAPVDFSDLSSEYIGILYEGLLDFELKTAPAGDPVVFLAVGNQPALPLSRLEAMDDKALTGLLEKMQDTSQGDAEGEAESEEAETAAEEDPHGDDSPEDDEDDADTTGDAEPDETEPDAGDERHATRTRAEIWARRAVEVGKLARKPRGALTPEKRLAYEDAVARKARQLVVRVILPGEWYVVRWGGTRKGSGTFYTRPGLAVPTVQRTLRPLAYTPPVAADGNPDLDAPHAAWMPRIPEEILALKVCDPACGSGTFPVAALRFLTEALYASLHHHGRVAADGDRAVVNLLGGETGAKDAQEERLGQELLPCRPDDPLFEPRLKAILRRHVVERCIYGVDLDPLAVELCRLALWIETMDRTLPFSFLDHKVKCGNSLVGAWFDQFQHYPAMAWKNREGGDKGHANGVHFEKEARTKAIKAFVKDRLAPDLRRFLEGRTLFSEDLQEQAAAVHTEALATLSRLHDLPVQDSAERARLYREELLGSAAYRSLKAAMDLWCACWFWPADDLEHAPLPTTFAAPPEETHAIAHRVAARKRFFHWELEFPDVFRAAGSGFDAMLGNPPWDIAKPNSKEFFSNIDPLYRSYGKQEALRYQTGYFAEEEIERAWLDYNADFRAQSNTMGYAASPAGDPNENGKNQDRFSIARGRDNDDLHARWREARAKSRGFADPSHPFRHQGSADLNLYKAFIEQAHTLLRSGGRLGFIVPSGLYSDHGTGGLRHLFLDRCRWEWLFGFENRDGIFEIHRSYKFNPVIIEKGGKTEAIHTAFMRRRLEDWERAEALSTPYTRAQVERFSPRSKAILEIQSPRDLEILEKIYANSVLLGDDGPGGWGIKYATEFHMTNDSKLFPPRPQWEADGYRPDEYSRWLKGDWRPIAELWSELGIDATRVVPLDPACEADLAARAAEVHRTPWRVRCAQPPYDTLPIPRADIPAGIILSRDADAWIREGDIPEVTFTDASDRLMKMTVRSGNGEEAETTVTGPAIALPLYQGVMLWQQNPNRAQYVRGSGIRAEWSEVDPSSLEIVPQFLVSKSAAEHAATMRAIVRPAIRGMQNATNQRTLICACVPAMPCGHSIALLIAHDHVLGAAFCLAANSFVVDSMLRPRMSQNNITWHYLQELPLPRVGPTIVMAAGLAARLTFYLPAHAPARLLLRNSCPSAHLFALRHGERTRFRAMCDALVACLFGLGFQDYVELLADCDHLASDLSTATLASRLDPKGFWRVDKDKDPELRHTVLTLVAFHDLEEKIRACGGDREKGIEAFLAQNDGEGWTLPETLRLADYGLGHDERAKQHQPVAGRLGPRFYDWQLAQTPEESWRECHLHARNLLGEAGYRQLLADIAAEGRGNTPKPPQPVTSPNTSGSPRQGSLFS